MAYFIDGNEAVARAAVAAGCTFFAGYPITPATSIYQHMLRLLPPAGGVCLQGEDEISSIGFCLGASMAGRKVLTATSGPGISLCSEQISFAVAGEIPIVIVDVQRLGPATGSATKGADGDIQFLRWGTSGGLPVVVLAPVDSADCYQLTLEAFNISERYRVPVFIASNKEVAMTRESVTVENLGNIEVIERTSFTGDGDFLPFKNSEQIPVPHFLPIGGNRLVRQTSSTHGEDGYITMDPKRIDAAIRRMAGKLTGLTADSALYELDCDDEAKTVLITYGVTARAAREAVKILRGEGLRLSLLVLKLLYPVPEDLLRELLEGVEELLVIEMNLGQYHREVARLAGDKPVRHRGVMNGELITPEMIVAEVKR